MPDISPTAVLLRGLHASRDTGRRALAQARWCVSAVAVVAPQPAARPSPSLSGARARGGHPLDALLELLLHLAGAKHAKVTPLLEGAAVASLVGILLEDFGAHALRLRSCATLEAGVRGALEWRRTHGCAARAGHRRRHDAP